MSLVKELTIKDGKLYQYPVEAVTSLRQTQEQFSNRSTTNNTYELELHFEANSYNELVLFADHQGKGLTVIVDTKAGHVTIDRSQAGEQYALEFGTSRSCQIDNQPTSAAIFIDKSIFEIFINKGEKVFTGRVFPGPDQTGILLKEGSVTGKYFELKY